MQFISQGAVGLNDAYDKARSHMFLFSSDVTKPTASTSLKDLMDKIDRARSYSHSKDSNNNLLCTRAAGWKSNKYYHTIIGRLRYDWDKGVSGGDSSYLGTSGFTLSQIDVFKKFYSAGAPRISNIFSTDTGSVFDFKTAYETPNSPQLGTPVMLLPAFEGTLTTSAVFNTGSEAYTASTASSGNIGTIGNYENRTNTYFNNFFVNSQSASDFSRVYSSNTSTLTNAASGAEQSVVSAGGIAGPRVVFGLRWSSAGTRYFSGGGWVYNYTQTPLTSDFATSNDGSFYGKGTQADTANYAFSWALMPVTRPDNIVVLQLMSFGTDLTQTGTVGPTQIPQVQSSIPQYVPVNPIVSV
ncbi:putative membrane protein [Erwinia phage pEa_SNUABM_5]|uniref:Putative membrane protein n=1 Tax=Erwinia phage pEa_SNUABM_5 TaxID=2797313 RepID=A0A7T8EPE5_9CAUD|nr:hypothetical protein MPK73_gp090 [Erwinia phage pEa_SNUABM_5]QQO90232.1 putative membrane protein [Erwinia phage pEa_SNUABM_5]